MIKNRGLTVEIGGNIDTASAIPKSARRPTNSSLAIANAAEAPIAMQQSVVVPATRKLLRMARPKARCSKAEK